VPTPCGPRSLTTLRWRDGGTFPRYISGIGDGSPTPPPLPETAVSIVRIGMAETKNYSDGYDAIFGKKKAAAPVAKKPAAKKAAKKPAAKKTAKKK
jgi:hypothetical protein